MALELVEGRYRGCYAYIPARHQEKSPRSACEALNFLLSRFCPNPPEKYLLSYYALFRFTNNPTTTILNTTNDYWTDKMGSTAYQKPSVNINNNVGNVTDSYKNIWNNCEISVLDVKRHILEWLSPMVPRERHQAVRESRVDAIGNRFLRTSDFEKWHTSTSRTVNPVLFYYGNPGVGKTYLRCVAVALLKLRPELT